MLFVVSVLFGPPRAAAHCWPASSFATFFIPSVFIQRSAAAAARLTDDQLAVLGEVVLGDLEVEGGGAFPDAARDVVVGAVAGAEPAAVVAGLADGHTTQMGADA